VAINTKYSCSFLGGVLSGSGMASPMHPGIDRKRPAPPPDPRIVAAQQIKAYVYSLLCFVLLLAMH